MSTCCIWIESKGGILIYQCFLTERDSATYIIDTENAEVELVYSGAEEIKLSLKNDRICFIWLHGSCKITGETNLTREELLQILEYIV